MARGRRLFRERLALCDAVVEVRDARAPRLTASPMLENLPEGVRPFVLLAKADLAEPETTRAWLRALEREGRTALACDLRRDNVTPLVRAIVAAAPANREARAAVAGIPNVGKSQLLNRLVNKRAAKVGNLPGVTRGVTFVKGNGLWILDTPGIVDPKADARVHRMLTWLAETRGDVIGFFEGHARECLGFLLARGLFGAIGPALKVEAAEDPSELLERVGRRYGRLSPGGEVDREGAGRAFRDALSTGRLGRLSLERPGDPPPWEDLT
jgi:ribosome biogenesis GTPase A